MVTPPRKSTPKLRPMVTTAKIETATAIAESAAEIIRQLVNGTFVRSGTSFKSIFLAPL